MCASHWDRTKPKGVMKVNVGHLGGAGKGEMSAVLATRGSHPRGVSLSLRHSRRTQSVHVGTRKMVNYAWSGRSQGKP